MASISRSRGSSPQPMAAYGPRNICLIVGLTCLIGFVVDMVALGAPPNPGALEWRINFLQQIGDRSIVLMFGLALVTYGLIEQRSLVRIIALACLVLGISFQLGCILVIRDAIVLKNQTLSNIDTQAQELRTRIQESEGRSDLPPEITPEQLQQASQQVNAQAEALRKNTSTGITKALIASAGNLVVVGLGLIGLGRFGTQRSA